MTATEDAPVMVAVKLTEDEWKERCDELASELKVLESTEEKKAAAAKKYNAEIKVLKERISVLTEEVDSRHRMVEKQMALDLGLPMKGKRAKAANDQAAATA